LVIGGCVYVLFSTWNKGRKILADKLYSKNPSIEAFIEQIREERPYRAHGKAVFMAGSQMAAPPALLQNFKHNKVIHKEVVLLTILTAEIPRVKTMDKVHIENLGAGFWKVTATFGYMEQQSIPRLFSLMRGKGMELLLEDVSFFIGREQVSPHRHRVMSIWREKVFSFLSRNALSPTRFL
jgi:KUP system potassium uptake protein